MIYVNNKKEIQKLRYGGKVLAKILNQLQKEVKVGVSAKELEKKADSLFKKYKVVPSFKGYQSFPASICISFNEELVHGIPSDRVVKGGDLVSLDAGAYFGGYHTDAAVTVGVGQITARDKKLIQVTKKALLAGIREAKPGKKLGNISNRIQKVIEDEKFSVIRDYAGHFIGKNLHEIPNIPNFGKKNTGIKIEPGMVLALEPMVACGSYEVILASDGWTAKMEDGCNSAHFEHTILITKSGAEILTA